MTLAQVQDPVGTVWVTDFQNGGDSFQCVWLNPEPIICTTSSPRAFNCGGYLRELHQGRTNVLFCDGHVKAVKLDYLAEKTTNGTNVYKHWTVEDD